MGQKVSYMTKRPEFDASSHLPRCRSVPTIAIVLGHGSGGKLCAELIAQIFLPAFSNSALAQLDDQAIVNVNGSARDSPPTPLW